MKFYLDPRTGEDGKRSIVIRGRDSFGKQYRIFLTSAFKEARIEAANWKQKEQKVKANPTLGETLKKLKSVLLAHVMKQQVINPVYNVPDAWKELYVSKPQAEKDKFPEKVVNAIPLYKEYYTGKKSPDYLRILDQLEADLKGWNPDIVFSKLNYLALDSFKSYLTGTDKEQRRVNEKRKDKKGNIVKLTPLESATVYSRFKYLREVSKLAQRNGIIVDPAVYDFKVKYVHRSGGFALTYPEIMKIFHYKSDNETRMSVRDHFLLEAFTGIRNSHCADLRNGNIQDGFIQYFDTKNEEKLKTVTRHKLNEAIIKKYYDKNKPNEFLLPRVAQGTINKELKFIARELKLDRLIPHRGKLEPIYRHLSSHDGRHSYATVLNSIGVPADYVREELGHSQGITFGTYVHRNDRYDLIREAINKLPTEIPEEKKESNLRKAV